MATTTPNFGWSVPTSTDLVKDGATAIETLGDAIDASLLDLKGGTTGQVLSKNSNTDMDFTWVAQDDSNAIQNALLTTTGDTIYASGASTPARLGIGSTGQVLTVSGGVPSWATPATSSTSWTLLNAGGTALTGGGASTRTVSFSSQNSLLIVVTGASTTAAEQMMIGFNSDSGANYDEIGLRYNASGVVSQINSLGLSSIRFAETATAAGTAGAVMLVSGAKGTGVKSYSLSGASVSGTYSYNTSGRYNGTSAITSVNIQSNSSAWDAGTVYVYGA